MRATREEHETVRILYLIQLPPDYPNGFEAELHIPRAKLATATLPPFWRDGETITINPVPPTGLGR